MKTDRIIILIIALFPLTGSTQQLANWSSFYENGFIWNPALTARYDTWEVSATHRQEWTGFEDAPTLSMLAVQFPFAQPITRVTIGLNAEIDQVGPYRKEGGSLSYAYRFRPQIAGKKFDELRIGMSGQFHRYSLKSTTLVPFDGLEADLADQSLSNQFNASCGIYYSSHDDNDFQNVYFGGLSINQIIPSKINVAIDQITQRQHISINGGYR